MTPSEMTPDTRDIASDDAAERFIAKWNGVGASELSTSQSFLIDLCHLLGVDTPHPTPEQAYMFERPITFAYGDGSTSAGRIDLYRRGAFVLEAKKLKAPSHTKGFDDGLLRARTQAEQYARALPADEGRPPFVVVVDVGNRIELYAEFSRSGATYTPFPDPRSHRIALDDLRKLELRERLRQVWTDPLALDPSRESARVTREIAAQLADLAKRLEADNHSAEAVAQFLMRCLFTMFAEDVKLLPSDSFRDLMMKHAEQPDIAMRMLAQLWRDMDSGGFSAAIAGDVLRFNGKLFKQPDTLPLDKPQLALLIQAAKAKWNHVEPAIFGTLLERALSSNERHKLGAHYTPRAYVERLVLPTVIEPLRLEWSNAQVAAMALAAEGNPDDAAVELRRFHHRLCTVRVLDPACGSGNFLYVTLEHLKRLEGEVLNALDELGDRQTGLALGSERADAAAGETVDPHNLLGIELNPRAAAIAEVVLWIGYLQWHFRTRGDVFPPQPVIRDFRNIENRDAVLAYDEVVPELDAHGQPLTRWDGETMKISPITGEKIPDDSARKPVMRYVNPRKAAWPEADFVVGNPPFIGNKRMRTALGDGYVEALRETWPDVPESADLVMYWWHCAALLTRRGALERFGLITTNSIRQAFNRRVIEAALLPSPAGRGAGGEGTAKRQTSSADVPSSGAARHLLPVGEGKEQPLSLVFAIPDHPWVDAVDGAAVRIAMTVAARNHAPGRLLQVTAERDNGDEVDVDLSQRTGLIHADLRTGANVASAQALRANHGLSCPGLKLHGAGFIVKPEVAEKLGLHSVPGLERYIRPYRNGRDLTDSPRGVLVIDLYGLGVDQVFARFPAVYQHLLEHVKPERDQNNRATYRDNWWLHGEARSDFRPALLNISRYVATAVTAKHRLFQFMDASVLPDDALMNIAVDDALYLGVLSSRVHVLWAIATGSTLEDRPRYIKSRCFDCFPFPASVSLLHLGDGARIRTLAENLDTHRKRQQAAHPELTLTGMYNVLDKLRSGEALSAKERVIHEQGLVSVLRQIHDELDAAVLDAYGWSDLLPLLRVAHGNGTSALLPSPTGRGAGGEGESRRRLPKAPLPQETIAFARTLRREQTDAETLMWMLLRDRRLHGMKFRRQHPVPPYTLDFYCHPLKLAVELDGSQHLDSARDQARDAALNDAGIEVLRYWNHDVLARTEQVLDDLWNRIDHRLDVIAGGTAAAEPSPPAPLPVGEGGAMTRDEAKRAFDDAVLERLVALNAERAAEEARGIVRWLRPEFQNPQAGPTQQAIDTGPEEDPADDIAPTASIKPQPWPKDAVAQVRAVADALSASAVSLSLDEIAARFTARGPWKKRLPQLLDMLVAMGRAREDAGRFRAMG